MSWLLVFLGFSLLIVLHEAGHFAAAKATGMRVERFFLFFGPKLISVKRGETEYGIASIPLGGYVRISGMNPEDELPEGEEHRGYYEQPVWKRIVVIGAGPAVNILLAFAVILAVLLTHATTPTPVVGEVLSKSPAAGVLRPGDRLVAVDGSRYLGRDREGRVEGFRAEVGSHACPADENGNGCRAAVPARLTIERGGRVQTIAVRPEYSSAAGRALLGIGFRMAPASIGLGEAVDRTTGYMWEVASRTVTVFAELFNAEKRKEVSGVVGVSDVAHQTIEKFGAADALILLAVVSLSLGLINLFPFLPLDGGHIFWSLLEKVRGSRIPFSVMERASAVGFVLVVLLMVIGLSNDIGRLTGEGINVR